MSLRVFLLYSGVHELLTSCKSNTLWQANVLKSAKRADKASHRSCGNCSELGRFPECLLQPQHDSILPFFSGFLGKKGENNHVPKNKRVFIHIWRRTLVAKLTLICRYTAFPSLVAWNSSRDIDFLVSVSYFGEATSHLGCWDCKICSMEGWHYLHPFWHLSAT